MAASEPIISATNFSQRFLEIEYEQCRKLNEIEVTPPVCYVYNPLEYARSTHENYVRKYCHGPKEVLFLGMNPGPFGMAQNGVPFGEVSYVRNWLRIEGKVEKPSKEHPKRTILGLECKRSEVSGQRFWGLFEEVCQTPDVFFKHCFVHNFCPFSFLRSSGKNLTPPELNANMRKAVVEVCSEALYKTVELLQPKIIVGVGKFAEEMASKSLKLSDHFDDVDIYSMMHPSPLNPKANKGWKITALKQLEAFGVMKYIVS